MIGNEIIFPSDFNKVCEILKKIDNKLEMDGESCTSIKYSIGVYSPVEEVESILFCCEGYYK